MTGVQTCALPISSRARCRRIVRRQRAREVLRIDIGDERDVDTLRLRAGASARARRARQRRADEKRSEIGPADAEIDDGANGSSCRADAQAAADLCDQRPHSRLRRADIGNDVAALHDERRIARLAQRLRAGIGRASCRERVLRLV